MSELRKLLKKEPKNRKKDFWYNISWKHQLSESFIRKFQDKVGWYFISSYQTLSESFILEFKGRIRYDWLKYNEKVTITEKNKTSI